VSKRGWTKGGPGKPVPTVAELLARAIPEPNTGCMLWPGAVDQHGYAQVRRKSLGGTRRVARLVAMVPAGMETLHSCDVPACINPEHLSAGTHPENMADMTRRGRAAAGDRSGPRRHPERLARGSGAPWSKLTEEAVAAIRADAGQTPQRVWAERFGVSQSAISRALRGDSWK